MITFKEFMNEMAYISGKQGNDSFSLRHDWDTHFKEKSELLVHKLPKNYKLYHYMGYYFLTNKNNKYLGYIQLKEVSSQYRLENTYQIKSSNSTGEVKGFYNIMFTTILAKTNIEKIISDDNLSTNALNSYIRLDRESKLTINMFDKHAKDIQDFDKNEIKSNPSSIVLISENKEIKNVFKIYEEKINTNLVFKNDLLHENESLYIMLYTKYKG